MLCVNATYLVSNYHICELCNDILLQDIIYLNYAVVSCCEALYMWIMNAMLFSQASYMWIISCHPFLYYIFHLLTTFIYSTTLPVRHPFESVMEKAGVKTRSSEQTMLSDEAHVLLVTDSSLEEDSETDDQSYPPPPRGACSNLAGLCCSYRVYGILHCYVIFLV